MRRKLTIWFFMLALSFGVIILLLQGYLSSVLPKNSLHMAVQREEEIFVGLPSETILDSSSSATIPFASPQDDVKQLPSTSFGVVGTLNSVTNFQPAPEVHLAESEELVKGR